MGRLRQAHQRLERVVFAAPVGGHHDPFGLLDDRTRPHCVGQLLGQRAVAEQRRADLTGEAGMRCDDLTDRRGLTVESVGLAGVDVESTDHAATAVTTVARLTSAAMGSDIMLRAPCATARGTYDGHRGSSARSRMRNTLPVR